MALIRENEQIYDHIKVSNINGRALDVAGTVNLGADSPGITSLANIDTDIGATNSAAASSDTGTFSLIALVKRGLQNWTTLLSRIPSLVSGSIPVTLTTAANLGNPSLINDVASAALAATSTTSAFTPTSGPAYSVNIPVTVVSGSTPTLDVSIEESDDNGTNWFKVYDFPRITTTGMYRSPIIRLTGTRVRYVQTVGGSTPSFTRSINRLQSSTNCEVVRQLVDRSISITTLNSTTPSLDIRDAGNRIQLVINVGAITTTAPAFQIEGSDDNGTTWYAIGSPLTAVANTTVQATTSSINSGLARVRVSTAGVGATPGYVMLKAHD